jgi:eukaryotic-like serine/threonine-protein kinase
MSEIDVRNARDLYVADVSPNGAAGAPRPFVVDGAQKSSPRFSPDGRFVAHTSNESGRTEVYVRPLAGPAGIVQQVSTDGGVEPVWSADGRRLFYRSPTAIVAATVSTDVGFSVQSRAPLFADDFLRRPGRTSWDASGDGARFLLLRAETADQVTVVLNWPAELRARDSGRR